MAASVAFGSVSAATGTHQRALSRDGTALTEVTGQPLQLQAYTDFTSDPGAGAIATFSGVTRNNFDGKEVLRLEYEAYVPMAVRKLQVRMRVHWASIMLQLLLIHCNAW
jgi:molybdopterin synthase catalytic subunit